MPSPAYPPKLATAAFFGRERNVESGLQHRRAVPFSVRRGGETLTSMEYFAKWRAIASLDPPYIFQMQERIGAVPYRQPLNDGG